MADSEKRHSRKLLPGVLIGVVLAVSVILASGYMIQATNTDVFCVSCHVMKPFRTAWRNETHGGNNDKGLEAQCVDCHLPHGGFVEYVATKAYTGTRDIIMNMIIDPSTYDWAGRAKHRRGFTYDNACRKCHVNLEPEGMRTSGILAHRQYLIGDLDKRCVDCHEHVGHKNMVSEINNYFKKSPQVAGKE
ncbi:cytochrome c3 family protein [Pseudodesulfovibrio piezophilus]|uniref:Cytochrome c-type protein n=1 Tax=Pseudodesulfovibrio piezophilus (strain DSM 21447 / JCM 15486 / C1TLV30) TaxID=1322246 RepID=M1WMW9_PSEP2|nr:NapC/NirT family cytochrome c [Pseudodesulfovibrio piezophilus]CCH50025.1 putative Acetyl-coenzyme A carboxylase carboxyl transferase subunit alpha [Pseudodesulfovibrio piezophilus C1TLV30]